MEPAAPSRWTPTVLASLPAALAIFLGYAYLNFMLGGVRGLGPSALFWMGLCALIQASWLAAVPRKARPLAAFALVALNLALMVIDICYLRVFGDIPSVRALSFSAQGVDVWESVWAVTRARDLLLAGLLGGAVVATWALGRGDAPEPAGRRRIAVALAATVLGGALFAQTLASANQGDRLGLSKLWNRVETSMRVGAITFHVVELAMVLSVEQDRGVAPAEVEALAAWLAKKNAPGAGGSVPGLAAGRNALVIQVEALQAFAIGRTVAGQPVTPHLDALRGQARYYPDTFCQIAGGGTSDAEFMAATSMYPVAAGATFVRLGHQAYPTALPMQLRERGYTTLAMHAFPNPGFWNRTIAYPSLGFSTFVDGPSFGKGEIVGLGLSDREFLARGLEILEKTPQPFYAMLVTLSTHHPFKGAGRFGPQAFDVVGDPTLANYLRAMHYVDAELGRSIARMRATGMWDRTAVVIYGDHPGWFRSPPALERLIGPTAGAPVALRMLQRVPLFVHLPGDAVRGAQPVAAGQLDIMPTLARALGVPTPTAFGQDLTQAEEGFVAFRDGSLVAGRTYHHGPSGTAWSLDTGKPAPAIPGERLALARRHFAGSDLALQGNLLPRLAGVRP